MSARSTAPPPRTGDPIPEFSARSEGGRTVGRAELLGHPAVLYFYPKANSAGCSIEAREFARHYEEFRRAGVAVVGVSVDPVEAQRRFRERCALPFELIADVDGVLSGRFGVLGRIGMARRTTFLIGADGTVLEVVRSWRPKRHVERALERFVADESSPATSRSD